jgi:hypothetical protein
VPGVADALGEAAGAVVTFGLAVTVTVDVAGAADVGGAAEVVVGAADVGGAAEVVVGASGVVAGAPVMVALRLGRLLITLLAVLPHPAVRHAMMSRAAGRERLFAGRRMLILSRLFPGLGTAVMISPIRPPGLIP